MLQNKTKSKNKNACASILPPFPTVTSSAVLLVDAVLDAVVLLVDVLVASDLTEHAAGLLGQPALD